MTRKYYDALDSILDRPIAFNPAFKKVTGSTNAALLLSQAFYWTKRTADKDGWFYKTRNEWMEETGLTLEELDGARAKCKATGVIEEKLRGVPATVHYRINKPKVYELLGFQFGEIPQSGFSESPKIGGKPDSGSYPNFNKESESTSGTTEEEETVAHIKELYEQNIGAPTPLLMKMFCNAAKSYPREWFQPAFEAMVKGARHRSWNFVEAVLDGWMDNGFGWKPEKNANGHSKTKTHLQQQPQLTEDQLAAAREDAKKQLLGDA